MFWKKWLKSNFGTGVGALTGFVSAFSPLDTGSEGAEPADVVAFKVDSLPLAAAFKAV